jgi:hypothetical protein
VSAQGLALAIATLMLAAARVRGNTVLVGGFSPGLSGPPFPSCFNNLDNRKGEPVKAS